MTKSSLSNREHRGTARSASARDDLSLADVHCLPWLIASGYDHRLCTVNTTYKLYIIPRVAAVHPRVGDWEGGGSRPCP